MIINNQITAAAGLYMKTWGGGGKTSASSDRAAQRPADEVVLSGEGRTFSASLRELHATSDDVRHDKVEELRARIAAGNYRVPSADIAEKMLGLRF